MIATIHGKTDREIDFAPAIEDVCSESNEYKHELDFYRIELLFLNKLINKYFYSYAEEYENTILQLQNLAYHLFEVQRERDLLNLKYLGHLHNCLDSMDEFMIEEYVSVRLEHEDLKREFQRFSNEYKLLKSEIFAIAEDVISSDRKKHLLESKN